VKKILSFIVLLALLAYFVWPTRYKHYPPGEGPYVLQMQWEGETREDRLTGDLERLETTGEWVLVGNTRKAMAFQRPDVNPNAIHRSAPRPDRKAVDDQQRAVEKTQKEVEAATKQAGN
jgi:hypothetical protein